ncbi:DNA (cytosine-5)-methyltransferase 3B-like [Lineus longissimus]|uniref:DNA (cytosine-5)-methyltransferase 3B-like n=1 Tax=Lineus longissimus TaxID=88925 RepID=UPI00315CF6CB
MEPTTDEQEPLLGKLVWARFGGHRWWPGIIVRGNMCYLRTAKYGNSWIYWFGDHKVSEVAHGKIRPFTIDFFNYLKKSTTMAKTFHKAVVEAIQVCCERAGFTPGKAEEDLLLWAENGFKARNGKSLQGQLDEPKGNQQLPNFVIEGVAALSAKIKRSKEVKEKEERVTESELKPTRLEVLEQRKKSSPEDAVADIRSGRRAITDTCLACTSTSAAVVVQHPFFEGGLCEMCKEELMDTMFAFGADGTGVFCIICGNGGDLFVCDKTACNRVYCTGCIVALVAPSAIDLIHKTEPWLCFMCSEHKPETHGILVKKANWKQNVHGLFNHTIGSQPPTPEDLPTHRMRVLSLFDGIGTGKFVLDQLGFDVEFYFASEIDQDAINVTKMHHKDNVTHLGDVRTITVQKLNEIGPIDLLIGGSPCNELSLCNPARKGLGDGTGRLFFEYYRILNTLQKSNRGRHLFWLFENVVSMPKEVKSSISRFFGCEPAKLNSKYFSAQQRARYFWGNLPGIYCPPQLDHFTEKGANLNNVLTPFCNRVARFEKIQTVTTKSNSFRQGHKDSRGELPVMMDGKQDGLWIPEVERLFGFPSHYTDIGYLGPGKRQKLIGKSWSIGVIRHLFMPLRQFFALRDEVESGEVEGVEPCL